MKILVSFMTYIYNNTSSNTAIATLVMLSKFGVQVSRALFLHILHTMYEFLLRGD